MKALRPFFTYYGGKWRSAVHYPAPVHGRLVEPFAGAAGYALRHHHRQVELYELDPVVSGVWSYLIRTPSSEIARLPLVVDDVSSLSIPEEAKALIGFWLTRGNKAPVTRPNAWMRTGKWPNQFWGEYARSRIARQVDEIRHWKVKNCSYETIADLRPASWFVDPPYTVQGAHYRCSDLDYEALADWCLALPGQVIVCEQDGASWLPFRSFRQSKSMKGSSSEVLWTNDPEEVAA